MSRYAIVVNLNRCTGCYGCMIGCKNENGIALGENWNKVVQVGPTGTFPDIEQYFGFVLTLFVVFGIAFEVPIAVIVLARIGIVSIEQLRKTRGYFIVGSFIVAAIVTPPDVISQLALAVPMCILYELGILAAQFFIKRTQAPEAAAGDKPAA